MTSRPTALRREIPATPQRRPAASDGSDSASADDDNTTPSGDNGADDAPPPIKQKPGCNCRLEATHAPADPALLFGALALVGGLVIRRRRRARRAA